MHVSEEYISKLLGKQQSLFSVQETQLFCRGDTTYFETVHLARNNYLLAKRFF